MPSDAIKLVISKAELNDIKDLREISISTFNEAFSDQNSEADINQYIQIQFSAKKLLEELREAESEFYFLSLDRKIIGYLKINFPKSQSDLNLENSMEIERIYIQKIFYGTLASSRLMEHAIQCARKKACQFIWLGVWEKNFRAIAFYKKFGFEDFGTHKFLLGTDLQTDILMKLNLELRTYDE